MNRYQFEDLISEYLENELSLTKRKEFESYLTENPDAKALVEAVGKTKDAMNNFPSVSASDQFNDKLMARIKSESAPGLHPVSQEKTWFGFTPVHASLMTGLLLAFGFISMQLISTDGSAVSKQQFMTEESAPQELPNQFKQPTIQQTSHFAEAEEDSSSDDQKPASQKDFSNKIHYVND